MKNVLVSLVSEQTLPNYLLLKEFQERIDIFLFISTKEMEIKNKTIAIRTAANLGKEKTRKIIVGSDTLYQIKQKLDKAGYNNKDNQYFVNLTCGTKLMSNAVYQYFDSLNSRFFYLPIGHNVYEEIFKDKVAEIFPVKTQISYNEYLELYNIDFKEKKLFFSENAAYKIFTEFQNEGFILDKFPAVYANRFTNNYVKRNNIPGLWFEEFMYYRIKDGLGLDEQQIATGIKLYSSENEQITEKGDHENDNEIDVMFLNKNTLYIIETKVSLGKQRINIDTLNNALYKLAALNKNFGLGAKGAVFTLADLSKLSPTSSQRLQKRCDLINVIHPVDRNMISDHGAFKKLLIHI